MRTRPLVALALAAASALLLAGCASADPSATPSGTPTGAAECLYNVAPGEVSDSVKVDGDTAGGTVTVSSDVELADLERTVLSAGDGDDVAAGDLLSVEYQIVDMSTGERVEDSATSTAGNGETLPLLLDSQTASIFVAALECQPLGSQVALAIPGSMLGEGASSVVVVAKGIEELPTVATGEPQPAVAGMPEVALADDGKPTVTIPAEDPPTEVEIAILKQGDGDTVAPGDNVVVQYEGVKWSDGTTFDGSWDRGAPSQFATSGVVDGFRQALEGQKVGSQVLVVIPPEFGYGAQEGHELQKETLVFVVDILAVQHAATTAG
ncbi:FKBP-type peptidyl-prolyl cis-trans isomerase [Microbacterium sp.]|uniref:FKBP-type peptidyl-prolyl cis-trans isomerase n=1 Tax=Microbacterium sp. TaxID=51671 RepID=UPI003F6E9C89